MRLRCVSRERANLLSLEYTKAARNAGTKDLQNGGGTEADRIHTKHLIKMAERYRLRAHGVPMTVEQEQEKRGL